MTAPSSIARLVLVADDDEDMQEIARLAFEHHGHRVLRANTGPECVDLAIEQTPDVVLLDLWLPGDDGWAVARTLRTDTRTKDIAIVAVTGAASQTDEAEAFAAGCDVFIRKPVPPSDLVRRVEELLSAHARLRRKHSETMKRSRELLADSQRLVAETRIRTELKQ